MLLGANQALSTVVPLMALQFTLMARECFDALQNWSDEHSYVKVILAGRSSGEITDEEAAQKVLAEYFEKNPDHLPTSNGRRFFCIASYDQRAIIKFSIQQNLYDLSTIFSPLRFFLDRNGTDTHVDSLVVAAPPACCSPGSVLRQKFPLVLVADSKLTLPCCHGQLSKLAARAQ